MTPRTFLVSDLSLNLWAILIFMYLRRIPYLAKMHRAGGERTGGIPDSTPTIVDETAFGSNPVNKMSVDDVRRER